MATIHALRATARKRASFTRRLQRLQLAIFAIPLPEAAKWNDDRDAVEFAVILGPYEGTVRIGRRVFQGLLDQRRSPRQSC